MIKQKLEKFKARHILSKNVSSRALRNDTITKMVSFFNGVLYDISVRQAVLKNMFPWANLRLAHNLDCNHIRIYIYFFSGQSSAGIASKQQDRGRHDDKNVNYYKSQDIHEQTTIVATN